MLVKKEVIAILFRTHVAFGLVCGMLAEFVLSFSGVSVVVFFVAVLVGSLVPDVDEPRSFFGRRVRVSWLVNVVFGHRQFLHTVWAGLFGSILLWLLVPVAGIGFFIGYISHVVGDGLTLSGVRPLLPLPYTWRGPLRTGSLAEWLVGLFFWVVFIGLVMAKMALVTGHVYG